MASTNWDTDRKRRRPPAWDPPKLLLVVVSGLHVVVGTSSVVGVVVDGGVWILGSIVWSQQSGREMGKRGKQGNREYSSKVLAKQGATLHMHGYMCKGPYQWTELQNARIRGGYLILSKTTLLAASVFQHIEESRLKSSK